MIFENEREEKLFRKEYWIDETPHHELDYENIVYLLGNNAFKYADRLWPAKFLDSLYDIPMPKEYCRFYLGERKGKKIFYISMPPGSIHSTSLCDIYQCHKPANGIGVGFVGTVKDEINIGDIIIPTRALIKEGASLYYGKKENEYIEPSNGLTQKLIKQVKNSKINYHIGDIVTVDSSLMEKEQGIIEMAQKNNILGIEMECSGLFSTVEYHRNYGIKTDIASILVVSDKAHENKGHIVELDSGAINNLLKSVEFATKLLLEESKI